MHRNSKASSCFSSIRGCPQQHTHMGCADEEGTQVHPSRWLGPIQPPNPGGTLAEPMPSGCGLDLGKCCALTPQLPCTKMPFWVPFVEPQLSSLLIFVPGLPAVWVDSKEGAPSKKHTHPFLDGFKGSQKETKRNPTGTVVDLGSPPEVPPSAPFPAAASAAPRPAAKAPPAPAAAAPAPAAPAAPSAAELQSIERRVQSVEQQAARRFRRIVNLWWFHRSPSGSRRFLFCSF